MTASGSISWDLQYDAAQFAVIPKGVGAEDGEAWVGDRLTHYGIESEHVSPQTEQVAATARMMLGNSRPGAAQLWFTPPGVYSDILVDIMVAASAERPSTEAVFEGAEFSTTVDVTPLRTETHGAGYIVRWGREIEGPDGQDGIPVAHWTVLLNDGTWTILMDVMGTTLAAFPLLEEQFPQLLLGVTVPGKEPHELPE